jgi:hypothetical protein
MHGVVVQRACYMLHRTRWTKSSTVSHKTLPPGDTGASATFADAGRRSGSVSSWSCRMEDVTTLLGLVHIRGNILRRSHMVASVLIS